MSLFKRYTSCNFIHVRIKAFIKLRPKKYIFSPCLQQKVAGQHQRANEDGAETRTGDNTQKHRRGQKAPHPGEERETTQCYALI